MKKNTDKNKNLNTYQELVQNIYKERIERIKRNRDIINKEIEDVTKGKKIDIDISDSNSCFN